MRRPPVDAFACAVQGSGMTLVATAHRPLLPILLALSGAHFLNDLISSMIPATYPLLKEAYRLDFVQVGLITLAFQLTASLLQPLLGLLTDHRPWPYAMVAGMAASLSGLLGLASAANYPMVLVSAATDRARLGRFPSRSDADGAPCGGRPARLRPGHFPDRGACRIRARPAAGRDDRGSARADEHRLAVGGGTRGDGADGMDRRALCRDAQRAGRPDCARRRQPSRPCPAGACCWP